MARKELEIKAKELGIKDAETLPNVKAVETAIKNAVYALKVKRDEAKATLDALPPDASEEDKNAAAQLAAEAEQAYAKHVPVVVPAPAADNTGVPAVGDGDKPPKEKPAKVKSFKRENGQEFAFADDAPESFRYLGVIKTREEWLADADAMELMISGRNPLVKLLKK